MWTIDKQQLLDDLRERADANDISDVESEQLAALVYELDQSELTALEPMLVRLASERQMLQAELDDTGGRNALLADLVARQASVLERARRELHELVVEHDRIVREAERALGHPLSAA